MVHRLFVGLVLSPRVHQAPTLTPRQHALQDLLRVRNNPVALSTHQTSLLILLRGGVPDSTTRKRIEELASAYGEVMKVACASQNFEKPTLSVAY